jgi:hypothetical protein
LANAATSKKPTALVESRNAVDALSIAARTVGESVGERRKTCGGHEEAWAWLDLKRRATWEDERHSLRRGVPPEAAGG